MAQSFNIIKKSNFIKMQNLSNTNRLKNIFLDIFQHKKNKQQKPQHQLKKHHWVLGSLVVLTGSWITHTTTATISDNLSPDQTRDFARLLDRNFVTDLPEKMTAFSTEGFEPIAFISPQLPTSPQFSNSPQPLPLVGIPENIPEKIAVPLNIAPIAEPLKEVHHTIKRGETLGQIFQKLSLDLEIPNNISQHETAKQLVTLAIGKSLTFKLDETDQLKEINYPSSYLKELQIQLDGDQVTKAEIIEVEFETTQRHASGVITTSLYDAAIETGLSNKLIMNMVQIFGWDVDFVQDIRSGDNFHVIYDEYHLLNGEKVADGNIIAAQFTTQGNTYRTVRFEDSDGGASYYTPEGDSMLGTFLRSPVEFSRISSGFGNRKHPILKTWKAHKGVDYAASSGTPIIATADGKVIQVGTNGGYGKTVTLRHAGRFTTLYAHMTDYAKNIRTGSTVKQGDVIGYVGSTGLATGPHLHYEFRVDGVHQNPLTYKTPKASAVTAKDKTEFIKLADQHLAKLDSIINDFQLAKASSTSSKSSQL